jgi:hypothetical protein
MLVLLAGAMVAQAAADLRTVDARTPVAVPDRPCRKRRTIGGA